MVWKCMAIDTDGDICARCITTPGRERPKDDYCPMGHRGTWAQVAEPTTECRSLQGLAMSGAQARERYGRETMDAVWLPVLWRDESLRSAVTAMTEARCSGILVEGDERFDVVMLKSVEQALQRGARTLGEVQDREPVLLPGPSDTATRRLDLIRPLRTGMEYQELLDSAGRTYALVAHAYDRGLVVTRHESGRQALSRSNTYYCRGGVTTHYFPRPQVQVDEECPKCLGQPKGKIFLR